MTRRRYALLVLFLPSLLFWPSSIGKEAWMTLALGLALTARAPAVQQVRRLRRPGARASAAQSGPAHMAVLLFGGLFVGYVLRPSGPMRHSPRC